MKLENYKIKNNNTYQAYSQFKNEYRYITLNTLNKRYKKPKEESRMDNPKKFSTLDTQDTGRRQAKQKTQHRKLKRSLR